MQTFLPYADYYESAKVLDYRRLGKQRVEAWQLLSIKTGWRNHPAYLMWKPYRYQLALYGFIICEEWVRRGYRDTLMPRFKLILSDLQSTAIPTWLGNDLLHKSHQSNLLRKDYKYYSQYGWNVPNTLPYYWPGANHVRKEIHRANERV